MCSTDSQGCALTRQLLIGGVVAGERVSLKCLTSHAACVLPLCRPMSVLLLLHLHSRKKPLTLLPLIALIFFEVSGGPFGTEVCFDNAVEPTQQQRDTVCGSDAASSKHTCWQEQSSRGSVWREGTTAWHSLAPPPTAAATT